jgi:hypothetical protein
MLFFLLIFKNWIKDGFLNQLKTKKESKEVCCFAGPPKSGLA